MMKKDFNFKENNGDGAIFAAMFRSTAVRDTQVYFGNEADPDPMDDDAWHDMTTAEVFIGLFFGTESEVLEKVAEREGCLPCHIRLVRVDEDNLISL